RAASVNEARGYQRLEVLLEQRRMAPALGASLWGVRSRSSCWRTTSLPVASKARLKSKEAFRELSAFDPKGPQRLLTSAEAGPSGNLDAASNDTAWKSFRAHTPMAIIRQCNEGHGMSRPESKDGLYQPQNSILRWLEKRIPIGQLIYSEFVAYPTPRNLNYWWTFGAILSLMLGVQLITGIVLAMHYTPHVDLAFKSIETIMRDVNYGWLLRYLHANAASMFFFAVYIHMFRAVYYGSYKEPYELVWILGVITYLLMVVAGFMGYVLVWGQMSFWAATVITNLFSAIPGVGDTI